MAVAEEYVLKFKGDIADLKSKIGSAQASIGGLDRAAGAASASFKKVGLALAGAFTAGKIISDMKSVVNEMDNISKASQRLGISTESLSKLGYVAKLADVEFGALEVSMRRMQSTLYDASQGVDASVTALKSLGLSVTQLMQLSPEEQFAKIASAVAGVEDPAKRTALAMDIFGRAGSGVINMAAQGEDAMRGLMREAEQLGVVFDAKAAVAAEEFNDSLTRLGQTWRGTLTGMASEGNLSAAVEGINGLTKAMLNFVGAIGNAYGWYVKLLAQMGGADLTDFSPAGQAGELGKLANRKKGDIEKLKKELAGKLSDPSMTANDKVLIKKRYDESFDRIANELKIETTRVKASQKKVVASGGFVAEPVSYGGGSSGGGTTDPLSELLKGTTTAKMAEYQRQIDMVNQGYQSGKVSLEDQQELIGNIRDDMDRLNKNEVTDFTDGLVEGIFQGVRSWDDFKRAGLNALTQIAIKAAQDIFKGGKVGGVLGTSGGGLGDIFGSVGKSIWNALPSFDSGGMTGNGVGGMNIDGKGGFPAILHPNEAVLNRGQMSGMGGGANVTQNIVINATAPADIDRRVMSALPRFKQEAMMGVQQALSAGGSMSRAVGKRL